MAAEIRVAVNGIVPAHTGIGELQRKLYPELERRGLTLVPLPVRDVGRGVSARLRGLAIGLLAKPDEAASAFLSLVPPNPFRRTVPTLLFVYDLRWMRTRSRASRAYRAWDLRRSVRSARAVLCISEATRRSLVDFVGDDDKIGVALLGPGKATAPPTGFPKERGTIILIGGARHKRNEEAAQALLTSKPEWCRRIIAVGLSDDSRRTLNRIENVDVECHDRPTDEELRSLYWRAETFLFLGVEEGFGLPFAEARASGCHVIAIDHPVAREVLGQAGLYLNDSDPEEIAAQLEKMRLPESPVPGEARTWGDFADDVEAAIRGIAHRP